MSLLIKALKQAELRHKDAATKALDEAARDPLWETPAVEEKNQVHERDSVSQTSDETQRPSASTPERQASKAATPWSLAPNSNQTLDSASDTNISNAKSVWETLPIAVVEGFDQTEQPPQKTNSAATRAPMSEAAAPAITPSGPPQTAQAHPENAPKTAPSVQNQDAIVAAPHSAPPPKPACVAPSKISSNLLHRRRLKRASLALIAASSLTAGALWLMNMLTGIESGLALREPSTPTSLEADSTQAIAPAPTSPETQDINPSASLNVTQSERPSRLKQNVTLPTVRADLSTPKTPISPGRLPGEGGRGVLDPKLQRTGPNSGDQPRYLIAQTPRPVQKILDAAYAALLRHEYSAARLAYEQALSTDPLNIDALLGMATLWAHQGQRVEAERTYQRVLEIDPNHLSAQAGLASIRVPVDPRGQESQLRHLLANDATQPALHFALGNSLAAQGRWNDAQNAYFQAYRGDDSHPDYAFNLAVSLEWLRNPSVALQYYRRALALMQQRPARFDRQTVTQRIEKIEASPSSSERSEVPAKASGE